MKKYVITGGPGIGKTTVIEILASKDYAIVAEAARMIIEEQETNGENIFPWTNLQKFQELVVKRQLALEEKTCGGIIFHDRSIIDGYGYSILGNVTPPELIDKNAKNRYEKIFVLEPLPLYQNDVSRKENEDDAKKIHNAIIEAYRHFGYEPVLIPVLPPEERAAYILSQI